MSPSNGYLHPMVAKNLLFFSGLAALVYQTIWIKQLTLVVGIDVYAVTTGVSGFFAGLALGSAVFGRLADRSSNPVRIYAALELGITILGVTATLALAAAPPVFVALQSKVGVLAWVMPFVLVAVPAALMGGTLPLLLAALRPKDDSIGRTSGQLYAANTAGAVVGALLTVFVIVPALGIKGTALAAAALNVVLAAVALVIATRAVIASRQTEQVLAKATSEARLAMALYAVAGGVALGYEVVWTQVIVQFLSTRAFAFAVVLATYLLGLVVGSWIYARIADRVERRWSAFGLLIAGAGVAALVAFFSLGPWLPASQEWLGDMVLQGTGSRMAMMLARFTLAAAVIVLPSTLLLGAAFPAAARLAVQPGRLGRDVGLVLALNTAFGIAGTVVTGFVLIPALGLAGSLGALAFVAALIGAGALLRQADFSRTKAIWAGGLVLVVAVFALLLPRDRLATVLAEVRGGELVFYDESPGGIVAVIEQQAARGTFRRLYIQGVSNTGDAMPSLRYMRLQALLPLLVHPGEPRSAMVLGLGTGITVGALLADSTLERRVAVELLQPVIDAAQLFEGNYGAGNHDPRLEIVRADGRHELLRREELFDVITLEPPPPAAAGVVNLYSRDFYEIVKRRLNEDGMLAQWWPIVTQNDEDSQSLVRSMLDVFPYVTLWTTEVHEMLLLGSTQPLELDYARIDERMQAPAVRRALAQVGVMSTADLLATYITDRAGLESYAGAALPVTDDRPRIEYASWVRPGEITRILPKLLGLSSPLPLVASEEDKARIETSFYRLLAFYEIAYRAYGMDRDTWSARVAAFRRDSRPNPYYDWVLRR